MRLRRHAEGEVRLSAWNKTKNSLLLIHSQFWAGGLKFVFECDFLMRRVSHMKYCYNLYVYYGLQTCKHLLMTIKLFILKGSKCTQIKEWFYV